MCIASVLVISHLTIDLNTNNQLLELFYTFQKFSYVFPSFSFLYIFFFSGAVMFFGSHGIPLEKINNAAGEESTMNCEREAYFVKTV